ncbi:ABC transporter permease [Cohnella candidum]|uniref:ABC transporter permease n=1 Tax=Cohnella candidum TaxID=2674991 RepID=A0A3G3K0D8_9BACL|nr:DUF2705 family protein [Cohnella candidum]AYQ73852.1 ABC transporter permease [Cohnella candidum]
MVDFWSLILNENMKIYRRVATWIMLGFVVIMPLAMSVLFYFAAGDQDLASNWWVMKTASQILFPLITIFTAVKASESVAGEFTWGTIKLLLIRPWSRSSILLSKYISTILFALFFTIIGFVVSLLASMALFGYSNSATDLSQTMNSPWTYMLEFYGLQFVSLIVIVTFGFMMSSAFRSSGLAIGLSIFLLLSGNLLAALFALADKAWVKYVMFLHLDLTSYLNGGTGPIPNQETTLGFSIAVLAVYVIIFNIVSWSVFVKRDVAA